MIVASFLSVFRLERSLDADGVPIEPKLEVQPGFVSYEPERSECPLRLLLINTNLLNTFALDYYKYKYI